MKARLLLPTFILVSLCFGSLNLSSQIPQVFTYQAIARDGTNPVTTPVDVKLTIQSTDLGGTTFWIELHENVQPNASGLFSLIVGNGVQQTGSTVGNFGDIDWTVSPKYLKTQIDIGSGFVTMGTSQLISVPYSLVAESLAGPVKKLGVTGTTTDLDEALFEVKNKTGQTVFAVYSEGVRIYVDDGNTKGTKGGFAIGGFSEAKAVPQDYFVVKPDTVRIYIDDTPGKGSKGGFAIGGFSETKGGLNFLSVSPDSTRVFTGDIEKGFGVGSFASGMSGSYLQLTPENYFIGYNSGKSITTGKYNSFMGYEAGESNTSGSSNIFIGFHAGEADTSGSSNLFIGNNAGLNNKNGNNNVFLGVNAGESNIGADPYYGWQGSNNVFLGPSSGRSTTSGGSNIFIGSYSGASNTDGNLNVYIGPSSGFQSTGVRNTFIGSNTGETNTTGSDNIFIGNQTGQMSTVGEYNTFLGSLSGWKNAAGSHNTFIGNSTGPNLVSGSYNVFLGSYAGGNSTEGTQNVFLGYAAGAQNSASSSIFIGYEAGRDETNGNRLYIENSSLGKNSALIYGEFDNDILVFNANVGIGTTTPNTKLHVSGNAGVLSLEGTDHCFISYYPDGAVAGRKGYVGYTGAGLDNLTIANEIAGAGIELAPGTGGYVKITTLSSGSGTNLVVDVNGNIMKSSSDISLKSNILPLQNSLDKLLKLQGVNFTWLNDNSNTVDVGFIAQEVEKVVPELIVKDNNDGLLSVKYPNLTALLVEAVKEQQAMIILQKEEIAALSTKLKEIENLKAEIDKIKSLLER